MNKLHRSLLLTGIVAAGLAGCGDDVVVPVPPAPPPPPVNSVSVAPDNIIVLPGASIQMTASVVAGAGCNPATAWSSSNLAVATVGATTGLVAIATSAPTGAVVIRATVTCATGGAMGSGAGTLNVQAASITAVTVTPSTANVNVGQTIQAAASVTGTNPAQTVSWNSLAPTVASVSTSGLITGLVGGTAVIQACSTVDTTKCGTAQINVLVPTPATVSIASVTRATAGGTIVPVTLTNVFGQIEIALNLENGSRQLSRVDALIGGVVVATQTFTAVAPPADTKAAGEAPALAPQTISLSVNTMQARKNGNVFLPVIFNGNSAITANLYVQTSSTPIASNAVPVVMNNKDAAIQPGLIGDATNIYARTAGTGNTVTVGGTVWYGNTATVDVATHFIAFSKTLPSAHALGSVGCGSVTTASTTIAGTPSTGIVVSGVLPCAGAESATTPSAIPGGTSYAPATSGPDGTGLVAPTQWSSVGSAFQVGGESRWNLVTPSVVTLAVVNVDNKAPAVEMAGDGVAVLLPGSDQVAFNDAFDQTWISNNYMFTVYDAITNPLGDMAAKDNGVGLSADSPKARQYDGVAALCGAANLPTQKGADFSETLTSVAADGKLACTYAKDLLGNAATSGPSNYFGVDYDKTVGTKAFPRVRLAGTTTPLPTPLLPAGGTTASISTMANTTIFGNVGFGSPFPAMPATDVWGLEALDDRSGFNQNAVTGYPAVQKLARLAQSGATSCALFTNPLNEPLSDTWIRTNPSLVPLDCALATGYYTYTGYVVDRAGNRSDTITRNFARDQAGRPTVTGFTATGLPYTPGAAGGFAFFALDDLEVIAGTIALTVPIQGTANPAGTPVGTALRYPLGSVSGLGTKWDATLTGIITNGVASVNYMFFRIDETCSGAGVPYAGCPAAPVAGFPYITAPKTTVSANYNGAGLVDSLRLPTGASGNVADVADQLAAASAATPFLRAFFNPIGVAEPWTGAPNLLGWDLNMTIVPGTVTAREIGITSITVPFFEGAQLFRINTALEWVLCGNFPAPVQSDNGPHRFWTYSLLVPTTGPCTGATFAAGASYRGLGRKVGAGLFTPTR